MVVLHVEEMEAVTDAALPASEVARGQTTEATMCNQGYGDVAQAFKKAAHVIELDLSIGRHSGVPLETRGAIGRYDAARDVLELHGAPKVPHRNRESLAHMLNRSTAGVHLYEGHTGGGFGVRGEIYPEDVLVLLAAMRLRRPVKWLGGRGGEIDAGHQSRNKRPRNPRRGA